jgi:hypothetical protein
MCIPKRLMTLTLYLTPELEQYLLQEASQQGLSIEAVTLQLLKNSILLRQKQIAAVNLQPRTPGLLPGKLGDAFFEPLPEEELQKWE